MEPQQDVEATRQAQEFNAKIEEVCGHLGVAIAAVSRKSTSSEDPDGLSEVRAKWQRLGRSFAELMDMEPPR